MPRAQSRSFANISSVSLGGLPGLGATDDLDHHHHCGQSHHQPRPRFVLVVPLAEKDVLVPPGLECGRVHADVAL
jgi:hypothetical protein